MTVDHIRRRWSTTRFVFDRGCLPSELIVSHHKHCTCCKYKMTMVHCLPSSLHSLHFTHSFHMLFVGLGHCQFDRNCSCTSVTAKRPFSTSVVYHAHRLVVDHRESTLYPCLMVDRVCHICGLLYATFWSSIWWYTLEVYFCCSNAAVYRKIPIYH